MEDDNYSKASLTSRLWGGSTEFYNFLFTKKFAPTLHLWTQKFYLESRLNLKYQRCKHTRAHSFQEVGSHRPLHVEGRPVRLLCHLHPPRDAGMNLTGESGKPLLLFGTFPPAENTDLPGSSMFKLYRAGLWLFSTGRVHVPNSDSEVLASQLSPPMLSSISTS